MASTWRNESGIGITISTNKFISSERITAPNESKTVETSVLLDTAFNRKDLAIGYFFRSKKTITGTTKKP